jgi:DNA-binding NarL/FixJ family response regulator
LFGHGWLLLIERTFFLLTRPGQVLRFGLFDRSVRKSRNVSIACARSKEAPLSEETHDSRIRLALVGCQTLLRASLGRYLGSQPGLETVGESADCAEALEILNGAAIDVVLLDFDLGTEQADELISAARRAGHQWRFIILATSPDPSDSAMALRLGASGIFLKSQSPDRLVQAIRLVATGTLWVEQSVIQHLADRLADRASMADDRRSSLLGDREQRVLLGILGGLTNRKIGDNIGLSEGSVKAVVQQLFFKAGVRTRSQLVRVALEGSLGDVRDLPKSEENDHRTALRDLSAARQSHE